VSSQGTLFFLALMVFLVTLGVARRMRPQPVRPGRILVTAVIIVAVLGSSFVATGAHLLSHPLAVLLAPVCLVAGAGLGFVLVRTMRFWEDPASGELWMAGGAAFAVILLVTLALRFGVRYLATGSAFGTSGPQAQEPSSPLAILSADLLFLTLGLWLSRAVLLLLRYREHQAQKGPAAGPAPSLDDR
jgi:hypothetical protein